jgi:tetratricopeptide (TPR) repeat protein
MNFLHFSDLHVGQDGQGVLWPTFKKAFFDDLRRMLSKNGASDAVFFSGDLTQRGSAEEFSRLTKILIEIWSVFREYGSNPALFIVPGNHDLDRPSKLNATAKVLKNWFGEHEIRQDFWTNKDSEYRKLIATVFSEYVKWVENLKSEGIPVASDCVGILPGDFSSTIKIKGKTIGVVGLNSSWLQLDGSDFKGKLHVDVVQLLNVTNSDPNAWCQANDFNFIITHHPVDWLQETSKSHWHQEVDVSARFDSHFFGHMHLHQSISVKNGGGLLKNQIQAASLFGLERINDTASVRLHGYSYFSIFEENERRYMKQWPRATLITRSGERKMVADEEMGLEDSFLEIDFKKHDTQRNNQRKSEISIRSDPKPILGMEMNENNFEIFRKTFPYSKALSNARQSEIIISCNSLRAIRALWLVADWGFGADEFIRALQDSLIPENSNIFQIGLERFFNKKEILSGLQEQTGYSFANLCEYISRLENCFIVFDDIRIGEGKDEDILQLQQDMESIISVMRQYCPDAYFILKSRKVPLQGSIKYVSLNPLNEADTAVYLRNHELGGTAIASPQLVAKIYRHTDGVPSRIDSILRDIPIVGVSELHSLNTDVTGKVESATVALPGVVEVIRKLMDSNDPNNKRAFDLLKALTVFPRGEQLAGVRRFNSTGAFYPDNVRFLLSLALIDSVEVTNINSGIDKESGRALVVRRSVREYLYTALLPKEIETLNSRAVEIYFGENWLQKGIKSGQRAKFEDRQCGTWRIDNACLMILRAVHSAFDASSLQKQTDAFKLAYAFCSALGAGDHYRSIVTLCGEIIPLYEQKNNPKINIFLMLNIYAQALRMCGKRDEAVQIYEKLLLEVDTGVDKQGIFLGLAFCYENLGNKAKVVEFANRCLVENKTSNQALQAKALVARYAEGIADRQKKLRALEIAARKKKAFIVANNVALEIAKDSGDLEKERKIYELMSDQAIKENDQYNAMRANLHLAKMHIKKGEAISRNLLSRIIEIYHYLHSESGTSLFSTCHDILWETFSKLGQTSDLVRLFRYSSLVWRLEDKTEEEKKYALKLFGRLGLEGSLSLKEADREMIYFLVRAANFIKNDDRLQLALSPEN